MIHCFKILMKRKELLVDNWSLHTKAHQGAALIRPERSVRQLIWVFSGVLLYTPLEVRICANNHTIATENNTENLPKICLFVCIKRERYCKTFKYLEYYLVPRKNTKGKRTVKINSNQLRTCLWDENHDDQLWKPKFNTSGQLERENNLEGKKTELDTDKTSKQINIK